MTTITLKRNIIQRIFGIPATKPPADSGCWTFSGHQLTIDLNRAPQISENWGAIHIENENLPAKILIFQDGEGTYHAFRNHCEHGGRKLDPVPSHPPSLTCYPCHPAYPLFSPI